MKKGKSLIKDIITIILAVFAVLIISFLITELFGVNYNEVLYKINPSDENLVRLSVSLIENDETDKMNEYLPEAAALDDLVDIIKENKYFLDTEEYNDEVTFTCEYIEIYSVYSYLFEEDYDGFHKRFPELYDKMANYGYSLNFVNITRKENKLTDKAFEQIIEGIETSMGECPEFKIENEEELSSYMWDLNILSIVYSVSIDDENYLKTFEECNYVINKITELRGDKDE